jgi:hypothetical protein
MSNDPRPGAISMVAAADPVASFMDRDFRVPFVRPALPTAEQMLPAVAGILASGRLTKGPFVERLERWWQGVEQAFELGHVGLVQRGGGSGGGWGVRVHGSIVGAGAAEG